MFYSVVVDDEDLSLEKTSIFSLYNTDLAIYVLLTVFILIIIASYIYSKCISVNDFYRVSALIKAAIHTNDTLTDILFIINITHSPQYPDLIPMTLLIASIFFVVLPVIISLYQLHTEINKWRRNDDISQWIKQNITTLYLLSIITGSSFTSVELCTSNLFNQDKFSMPLDQLKLDKFQNKKAYTMVLGEV